MHPSPALVPRLSALVRTTAKPPGVRLAVEHVETHAPMTVLRATRAQPNATANANANTNATLPHPHTMYPHPLSPLATNSSPTHPFRTPRKYLFFTTFKRTEPLPKPMVQWNDHLSMV